MAGTVGLTLLFGAAPRIIPIAAVGGGIAQTVYLLTGQVTVDVFYCSITAAAAVTVFSEICARIMKAPSSVFLTPSIIPLLPGSNLYYSMTCLVFKQYSSFVRYAELTLRIGLGIAVGIISVSVVWYVVMYYFRGIKKR